MIIDQPAPVRDALFAAGIRAERRLGQHFLFDLNICRKIARLAGPLNGKLVIEVGPGPGGLTRALLEAGASVIAVERDERFAPILTELAAGAAGRLTVVYGDALRIDERTLAEPSHAGARIVANLPFNVGTALLLKWLTGPFRPEAMTLMFQKEVAARIVAPPGGAEYGRLSVIAQALCHASIQLEVPARAFTPPPKVQSAVVGFSSRSPRLEDSLIDALKEVTRAAFGQRRKMLRSALRPVGGQALCATAGIDPDARAQTVTVRGYLDLARAWLELGPTPPPR